MDHDHAWGNRYGNQQRFRKFDVFTKLLMDPFMQARKEIQQKLLLFFGALLFGGRGRTRCTNSSCAGFEDHGTWKHSKTGQLQKSLEKLSRAITLIFERFFPWFHLQIEKKVFRRFKVDPLKVGDFTATLHCDVAVLLHENGIVSPRILE